MLSIAKYPIMGAFVKKFKKKFLVLKGGPLVLKIYKKIFVQIFLFSEVTLGNQMCAITC